MSGALQAILDRSVAYANERVAFERPISKFQVIQHNLARLAGEIGRRACAAGSAADTIDSAQSFDETVFLEVAAAKIRVGASSDRRHGDRAPGTWCHRLFRRARVAPLHAAAVGVARRFRPAKAHGPCASASWSPRRALTRSGRCSPRDSTE
jgi:alkylation response protein AidB-like acyl-CoA dehydrogenase